jgi:hypothetical protein
MIHANLEVTIAFIMKSSITCKSACRRWVVVLYLVAIASSALYVKSQTPERAPLIPPERFQLRPPRTNDMGALTVDFPGRYVREQVVLARIAGADLTKIVELAMILDVSPLPERLRPDELHSMGDVEWLPFQEQIEVDLGPGDGERELWFGFKYDSGRIRWQRHRIAVDNTPPLLIITHPRTRIVAEPILQMTGYSPEQISVISYDFANSWTNLTGQQVAITERLFDPGQRKLATNLFQIYDLELAPGTNTITIRAADLAGNVTVTNTTIVLDLSTDTVAPEITIDWPTPETEVQSRSFRLRGRLSEANAALRVRGPGGQVVEGLVERDGLFWVPGLSLPDEFNEFVVFATDAAGNTASRPLMVKRSPIEITLDPIAPPRSLKEVVISGTVSDPNCTVWVNGVEARMTGARWEARNVPVNSESGTAVYQAVAIPNSVNQGRGYGERKTPSLRDMGNPRLRPAAPSSQQP